MGSGITHIMTGLKLTEQKQGCFWDNMPNMKITVLDMMSIVRYSFPLLILFLLLLLFSIFFLLEINEISL